MAYQALYRKWRPTTFNDVVGQNHIVNTLKNQITEGKIAHAYLFTGTRGTGKTSTAKIFSKAVNCNNNIDGNPCNKCDMCCSIIDNSNIDIIEIDAASNTGVANIREIIEQCRYSCAVSKYKIYIIDEVHMLSKGAFNALLKTLEEPPEHVIFILATTEIHMVPATILSRCQRFDFSVISIYDIKNAMKHILSNEGINVDDDALEYVAYLGNGSMRDSLSILDRCIAFKTDNISYEDIVSVVGAIDDAVLYKFATLIAKGDTASIIKEFSSCVQNGKSLDNFSQDLLNVYREMLNYSVLNGQFECSAKKGEMIKNTLKDYTQEKIINCIHRISELIHDLRFVSNKRVIIECALIKLATPALNDDFSSMLDRIADLEKKLAGGTFNVKTEKHDIKIDSSDLVKSNNNVTTEFDGFEPPEFHNDIIDNSILYNNESPPDNKINTVKNSSDAEFESGGEYSKVINKWSDIIEEIQNKMHLTLYFHISSATPVKGDNCIILQFPDKETKHSFDSAKENDILSDIITAVTGIKCNIRSATEDDNISYSVPVNSVKDEDIFSDLAKHSGQFPGNITID